MSKQILILLLTIPLFSIGQENSGCYVKKYYLLIQSTHDYKTALQTAQKASKGLNIPLDLRGLVPVKDPDIGLNLPADTCLKYSQQEEGVADSSDCYMARGRYDDGIYISIEYSNAFQGFARGYYIVVAASGDKKDPPFVAALDKAKTLYADAYIKTDRVYMCCMH